MMAARVYGVIAIGFRSKSEQEYGQSENSLRVPDQGKLHLRTFEM